MTTDLTQQEMEILLLTGSILWYADEEKEATERFSEMFAASLGGDRIPVVDLLSCMTALAQSLMDAVPEEQRSRFWRQVLPQGPL